MVCWRWKGTCSFIIEHCVLALVRNFSKFYRRYYDLISKFQVELKSLLREGLSKSEFYGDLVYKLEKIFGTNYFAAQFIKIISHYKKRLAIALTYCNRLHAWWSTQSRLATAFLFNCTLVGRTSDSMTGTT